MDKTCRSIINTEQWKNAQSKAMQIMRETGQSCYVFYNPRTGSYKFSKYRGEGLNTKYKLVIEALASGHLVLTIHTQGVIDESKKD